MLWKTPRTTARLIEIGGNRSAKFQAVALLAQVGHRQGTSYQKVEQLFLDLSQKPADKHSFGLFVIVFLHFTLKFRDENGSEKALAATRSRFLLEPGQQDSFQLL